MKTPTIKLKRNLVYLLLGLLIPVFSAPIFAQNFSGLQDKTLNRIDDVVSVFSDMASKYEGKVDQVKVTYDSERQLKITVNFSDAEKGYMSARVMAADKSDQKAISSFETSLENKNSPLEIEFLLANDVPEGTEMQSAYLEIKLSESKSKFVKKTFLYSLNKNWKTEINPENLIIPITLEPVGSAANLKENTETLVLPTKKVLKNLTVKPLTVATTTRIQPIKNELDGTWINSNTKTTNISKIVISGNASKIQVFGKCTPNDCDWGTQALKKTGNLYTASFVSSIATSHFKISLQNDVLTSSQDRVYKVQSRGRKTSTETFKKQNLTLYVAQPIRTVAMGTIGSTSSGKSSAPNSEAQGPDNEPISLWEELVADNEFEFPYEITNIAMEVYPDKNKHSGIFYYLPTAYHLRWNSDEGYNFKMIYGTASDTESTGDVRITGTLTPGITSNEISLMKSLLASYANKNSNYTYKELKIMPIKSVPTISLSAGLEGQYNIDSDKINVTISSSITNPIDVSWITDNTTKEEMQVALTQGVGINGTMTIEPESETVPQQLIPVRITISDPRTLGRFTLQPNHWRTENWENKTPFPVKLKKIHALMIEKQGNNSIPLIYTWNLNNTEVPASAKVAFNTSKMPTWIETKNKTERIWIEYSIADCSTCVNQVIDGLIDGTIEKVKNITFETFKIFESTNAAFLKIKVRSIQADPKGERVVELPSIRVTEDMTVFSTGPLYLSDQEGPNYEYAFSLVTEDGMVYDSSNWMSSTEAEMFIGMHNLTASIPELPVTESDED
ncbi:MAG TPA: hypothetical protein VKZ97_03490 [Flavobacteriaceae bacterium]|nr:hypothetical protein [Flavobacteriaceae bacterium]